MRTLILHGNPIDQLRFYRTLTVGAAPFLKKIDSAVISPRERDHCTKWLDMNIDTLKLLMSEKLPFSEKEHDYEEDDRREEEKSKERERAAIAAAAKAKEINKK